ARARTSTTSVVICSFGDGALTEGVALESLNMAALWNLPIVFLCENNSGGFHGRANAFQAAAELTDLPRTWGLPASTADATVPLVCVEAFRAEVELARESRLPRFVEAVCPPGPGNTTFFPHDATGRTDLDGPSKEDEEWDRRDPVLNEARRLRAVGASSSLLR